MSIWTSQNSSTVRPSVVFDSHRRIGNLPGQLQRHCLSKLNPFIHVPCVCTFTYLSSSIIFTADMSSSSRPWCSAQVECINHAHEHVNIPEYKEDSGRTRISGTRVRQTWGKWYIDTDIDKYIPLFRKRGPLSRSMWGSLRLAQNYRKSIEWTRMCTSNMALTKPRSGVGVKEQWTSLQEAAADTAAYSTLIPI